MTVTPRTMQKVMGIKNHERDMTISYSLNTTNSRNSGLLFRCPAAMS